MSAQWGRIFAAIDKAEGTDWTAELERAWRVRMETVAKADADFQARIKRMATSALASFDAQGRLDSRGRRLRAALARGLNPGAMGATEDAT